MTILVLRRNILANLMDPERAHGLIKMRTMDPVQKSIVRKLVSLIVVWKLV